MLAGIDCHTTARAGMSTLEQVLFVADKVEPGKLDHDAALAEVKQLAEADLDAAVLRYLDSTWSRRSGVAGRCTRAAWRRATS